MSDIEAAKYLAMKLQQDRAEADMLRKMARKKRSVRGCCDFAPRYAVHFAPRIVHPR
jgi:hypothetical protein